MAGKIMYVRLTDGSEVLGEFNGVSSPITIKNPLTLTIVRGPNGQPAKSFAPFSLVEPELKEVTLTPHALATVPREAPKDVADAWRQETSGILLDTSPKQILRG